MSNGQRPSSARAGDDDVSGKANAKTMGAGRRVRRMSGVLAAREGGVTTKRGGEPFVCDCERLRRVRKSEREGEIGRRPQVRSARNKRATARSRARAMRRRLAIIVQSRIAFAEAASMDAKRERTA